jgi:hypothetical protein
MKQTDRYTVMIISRSVLLRIRNVSGKICGENQKTYCVFCNIISFENRTVYEITWKNIVEWGRTQITIWRMRIACWIPKATNTHSEYVHLIAFSTATMVARTPVIVTLYVHCLFWFWLLQA